MRDEFRSNNLSKEITAMKRTEKSNNAAVTMAQATKYSTADAGQLRHFDKRSDTDIGKNVYYCYPNSESPNNPECFKEYVNSEPSIYAMDVTRCDSSFNINLGGAARKSDNKFYFVQGSPAFMRIVLFREPDGFFNNSSSNDGNIPNAGALENAFSEKH